MGSCYSGNKNGITLRLKACKVVRKERAGAAVKRGFCKDDGQIHQWEIFFYQEGKILFASVF